MRWSNAALDAPMMAAVMRQYLPAAGRVQNCQVFCAYATLIDRELYLRSDPRRHVDGVASSAR